uniref:C-type lectin domain-containing protein n=1 Tax=Anopheles farauti TaxID=69004 RepID=A0A182Q6P5_9DIPT
MNTASIALAIVGLVAASLPTSFGQTAYTVHSTMLPFFEAWNACIASGGYLAAPETSLQNDLIWATIKKAEITGAVWLSGTDIGMEGSWIWLSKNVPLGRLAGYDNFAAGEPNNMGSNNIEENCLNIGHFGSSKWNDASCSLAFPYVCEFKK